MGKEESAGLPENKTVFNLNNGLIAWMKSKTTPGLIKVRRVIFDPTHPISFLRICKVSSLWKTSRAIPTIRFSRLLQLTVYGLDAWQDFALQKRKKKKKKNIKRNSRQCLVHCWWRHAERTFWICWTGSQHRIFHISTRNLVWHASTLIYFSVLLLFKVLFTLRCLELLCFMNIASPLSVTKRVATVVNLLS